MLEVTISNVEIANNIIEYISGIFMTWHAGEGRQDLNASIDRKDPNKGYIIGNVQLVTQRVNTIKHTLGEGELYWWCKNIIHNKENAN